MKTVADIHADIKRRLAKYPGQFSHFFLQWIKFENNSDAIFAARGERGETYLQFRLALDHVEAAATIFETVIALWRERGQESRVFAFLTAEDRDGNGIWHDLAGTLREHEGLATLRIARTLLTMDIDFSRRNRLGQSPLSKMLLPEPRWQSLNALIQAKHLTIENIETAISEQSKDDARRNQLMSRLFASDIEENRGMLTQHVLHQAVQPQADGALRAATCRLFFDYTDEQTCAPAFFKLIGISNHAMFDDLIRLLIQNTMETVNQTGVSDVTTRKAYAQLALSRRLLVRDRTGEGALFKALAAGKLTHLAKISSLLRNDDLAYNAMVRGETVRKPVAIDKTSLAPTNPLLSLLLQPDMDGNTVFHWAVARSDLQALKRLFAGLASNDLFAVIAALPNAVGLTLLQMVREPEAAARRVLQGFADPERAQAFAQGIAAVDGDVRDFLVARAEEVLDLAKSVGRSGPLPPSFRLPQQTRGAKPATA